MALLVKVFVHIAPFLCVYLYFKYNINYTEHPPDEYQTVGKYFSDHLSRDRSVCSDTYSHYCAKAKFVNQDVLNVQQRLMREDFMRKLSPKLVHVDAVDTAMNFYERCLSNIDKTPFYNRPLLPIKASWFSEKMDLFEFLNIVKKQGIDYNYFFTLTVAFDDQNSRWILKMSKPKFHYHVFEYKYTKEYMDMCWYWDAKCNSSEGTYSGVVNLATELRAMMRAVDAFKSTPSYSIITIKELQEKTYHFDGWLNFLRNMTGINTLSESDQILYDLNINKEPNYLHRLGNILRQMGNRAWMNYFATNILLDECLFFPEVKSKCSRFLPGVTTERFCRLKTISNFEGVIEYAYASLPHAMPYAVKKMVKTMKRQFVIAFVKRYKPSDRIRKMVDEWLNATEVVIGNDGLYDEKQFDIDYAIGANFSESHDFYRKWHRRLVDRKFALLVAHSEKEKLAPTKLPGSRMAVYNPDVNKIFLQPFAIESPLYSDNWTEVLNYGGLGTIIGRELVRAVLHSCPEAKEWITANITINSCIEAQQAYMYRTKMGSKLQKHHENDMSETILGAIGTYLAFRAFRIQYPNFQTTTLSVFGFSGPWRADKLFWVMANLPNCYEVGGYFQKLSDSHQTPFQRISTHTMNTGSFWRAFKCRMCPNCHILLADD